MLHIIWGGRRDYLEVDMTPIVGMPSSFAVYPRILLAWSSIKSCQNFYASYKGVEESEEHYSQRNLSKDLKVCRLVKFLIW